MNLIKKLLFMLSLIAGQQLVKTGAQTEDCNAIMDVCLVVDRSGSICDSDPNFDYLRDVTCNNWKSLVFFIHGLVNSFNIGPNNVRVALVTFSSSSEVQWGLNKYTDKASLLAAIDGLAYIKGGTSDTASGLNLVRTQIFNAGNDRTNVAKLAIIVTDGNPTVPSTVPAAVQAVHASSIITMCVGVTNSIDERTLKALSSPPQQLGMTYFMVADFSTINDTNNSLQQQMCAVASTTTSGPDCGGTYKNLSGTITSPNYPSNYNNSLTCFYNIQIPPANSINITFISFDTEQCCDWLQVSCVSDSTKAAPKFSGSNLPPVLSINHCNSVRLLFYTDGSTARQGFNLTYNAGEGSQEGGLTMKPKNFFVLVNSTEPIVLSCSSRPNQPDVYPWWSFSPENGNPVVVITVPNCTLLPSNPYVNIVSFNTTRNSSTGTCNLTITISPSYYSVAGSYTCTDATLDYAGALVTFMAPSFAAVDSSFLGTDVVRGEQISMICSILLNQTSWYNSPLTSSLYIYSNDSQRPIAVGLSSTTVTTSVLVSSTDLPSFVCNINFTFSRVIQSGYATNLPQLSLMIPSRPVLYWPENTSMVITAGNGGVGASGTLICFVPANPQATYQWISEETRPVWIGSTVPVIHSGSYTCAARNSIGGRTYNAFKSITVISKNDCGGTYSNQSGIISSPNYPSNYSNNLQCFYYIQVPPFNSINITFISFATESHYDWLQASCDSNSSIPIQRFSGSTSPPFLSISSCSSVLFVFYTDSTVNFQGFSLRYNIGNGMEGGLTMKPINSSVRSDRPTTEPIILSCSSRANQPDAYPWWSFSTDGSSFSIITAPDCSVLPSINSVWYSNPSYFSTSKNYPTRTCNLTISSLYRVAYGLFACTDATLDFAVALVDTTYVGEYLSTIRPSSSDVPGLQGGITMKPINRYVRKDLPPTEDTILSCSSKANQTDAYPRWSFSANGISFMVITSADCNVLPLSQEFKYSHFSTSKNYPTRTCNLSISSVYVQAAFGLYMCTDATQDYAVALVDTIVLSFTVGDLTHLATEVVQGEPIAMTCNVSLLYATSPYFQLRPFVYIYSGDNQLQLIVSDTTASINVSASANVRPPYVCKVNFTLSINQSINLSLNYATNMPENISSTKTFPSVLYWPEETRMVIQGDDNGRVMPKGNLTCFVTANPPVTYQWTSEDTRPLPIGSTVTVTRNGTYTCTASNTIKGKTYEASKSINITIAEIADCRKNDTLIAGVVVLGIAVLLLLVVAIVQCVLLCRKKNSATMDVNYDFIDAVIRTDAEPAKPRVYELAERKRLNIDQGGAIGTSGRKDVPPPIPPMYDRIKDQTYDTEIHTEDKSQPYDTEIHTEDKSQPKLQTYDTEIPAHTEDKSDPYLALYE